MPPLRSVTTMSLMFIVLLVRGQERVAWREFAGDGVTYDGAEVLRALGLKGARVEREPKFSEVVHAVGAVIERQNGRHGEFLEDRLEVARLDPPGAAAVGHLHDADFRLKEGPFVGVAAGL